MTLLSPWSALLAAAVAVPLLLLLYFLKLRRRRLSIASTLLWHRAFRDLTVNAPFQRLQASVLLFLQLLLLLLLVVALGDPVIEGAATSARRTIVLVDQSASMSMTDVGDPPISRLDAAKATARSIVDGVRSRGGRSEVMIIAFARTPTLLTGFESRAPVLDDAIDAIAPTDEEARLQPALDLAGSFAGSEDEEAAEVVLISDGGVAAPDGARGFTLRSGRLRFVQAGPDADAGPGAARNVGIVSLGARREPDDPARISVFVGLRNAGPEPVETTAALFVDDEPAATQRVNLPAAADLAPGETSVTFSAMLSGGAVLTVRHAAVDALAADDTAAAIMPPPARPRIAIVHGANPVDPFLGRLVEEAEPGLISVSGLATYEEIAADPAELARRFDLIVFDRAVPLRLPPVPSLTVGAAPPGLTVIDPARGGGKRILFWRREHPIMRHVALDAVVYEGFGVHGLPSGAVSLADGPDGPVIALLRGAGAGTVAHVAVGFALPYSNWPSQVSVAIFFQNTLEHLTLARSGAVSIAARAGDAILVRPEPGARELVLDGPDVGSLRLPVGDDDGTAVSLPRLRRAGLYRVTGAVPPDDRIAVDVLSEVESDVRTRSSIVVNDAAVSAGTRRRAAPIDLWPWIVAAATALLIVEWIVFCRLSRA